MSSAPAVKFYYDYVSPYGYLASTQLPRSGLSIDYRPVAILKVMAIVNNQPSPVCPVKLKYGFVDTARWAKRYGVPIAMNDGWWAALMGGQVTMELYSGAALVAQKLGCFEKFHPAMYDAIWGHPRDVVSPAGRAQLLADAGLAGVPIWEQAMDPAIQADLAARNQAAADAGVFGVPTFAVVDELFFGNDRLEMVKEVVLGVAA